MPKIRKISIKNFRSIKTLDLSLDELTILVGNNDCGKSNILKALNLFFNNETDPNVSLDFDHDFNKYTNTNRRAKQIDIQLELELPDSYKSTNGDVVIWKKSWRNSKLWTANPNELGYKGYRIEKNRLGRYIYNEVTIPQKSNVHSLLSKIEFEYVPAIRSANYMQELRGRIYKAISETSEQSFREKSTDFEMAIKDNINELILDIDSDLKESTQLKLPNDLSSVFERLDFLSGEKSISLNARGDGIKGRYIPLILKFIAEKKATLNGRGAAPYTFIWGYEEPENNLEFTRAQELSDNFKEIADLSDTQIILTTHSPIFYNLHSKSSKYKVLYISNKDNSTDANEDYHKDLNSQMGLMPLLAPYIAKAEDEISQLKKELEEATDLIGSHPGKHCIFVEGPCDYTIYCKIIDQCFPELIDLIYVVPPPERAGADYVVNMLIGWEHQTKHLDKPLRKKAIGIVDSDNQGLRAIARLNDGIKNPKHSYIYAYGVPSELKEANESGIKLPVCLEEMWPIPVWREADDRGWLSDRSKADLTSPDLTTKLIESDILFSSLLNPNWDILINKKADPDSKVEWSNFMINKNNDEFRDAAVNFVKLLTDIFKEQKIILNTDV